MAKLLENTIEISTLHDERDAHFSHELGIDLWEVIRVASTKLLAQAFYPGPGGRSLHSN